MNHCYTALPAASGFFCGANKTCGSCNSNTAAFITQVLWVSPERSSDQRVSNCLLQMREEGPHCTSVFKSVGKRGRGAVVGAASCSPGLIFVQAHCNKVPLTGFVDSGSSCTMITKRAAHRLRIPIQATDIVVSSVSGQQIWPVGQINCEFSLQNYSISNMVLFVLPNLPGNAELLIGIDAVRGLGGATLVVRPDGSVGAHFGPAKSASVAAAVTEPV